MNREIKFRGRRLDNGEWAYGSLLLLNDQAQIVNHDENPLVDPSTVGQYTGLKDENGNRIYEGDILEIDIPKTYPRDEILATITAVVEWVSDGFYAIQIGMNDPILRSLYGHSGRGCRVIGNIHNNPELLMKK